MLSGHVKIHLHLDILSRNSYVLFPNRYYRMLGDRLPVQPTTASDRAADSVKSDRIANSIYRIKLAFVSYLRYSQVAFCAYLADVFC